MDDGAAGARRPCAAVDVRADPAVAAPADQAGGHRRPAGWPRPGSARRWPPPPTDPTPAGSAADPTAPPTADRRRGARAPACRTSASATADWRPYGRQRRRDRARRARVRHRRSAPAGRASGTAARPRIDLTIGANRRAARRSPVDHDRGHRGETASGLTTRSSAREPNDGAPCGRRAAPRPWSGRARRRHHQRGPHEPLVGVRAAGRQHLGGVLERRRRPTRSSVVRAVRDERQRFAARQRQLDLVVVDRRARR